MGTAAAVCGCVDRQRHLHQGTAGLHCGEQALSPYAVQSLGSALPLCGWTSASTRALTLVTHNLTSCMSSLQPSTSYSVLVYVEVGGLLRFLCVEIPEQALDGSAGSVGWVQFVSVRNAAFVSFACLLNQASNALANLSSNIIIEPDFSPEALTYFVQGSGP